MHSLSNERRQARARRRRQVWRRRIVVFSLGVPFIALAVWLAYSLPQTEAARVPEPGVVSPFGAAEGVDKRVVVAHAGEVDLILPVRPDATTAVAFHPVDNPNGVALSPVGERVDGSGVARRLADVFSDGGGMQYYLMDGDDGDDSQATAGLDVGAVPGVFVYSPVDGRVVSVKRYMLLGTYPDTEIQICANADPSLLLVVSHIAKPAVGVGDRVTAGATSLGTVRGFPPEVEQGLSRFTNDDGDHVQLIALRMTPQLSGF